MLVKKTRSGKFSFELDYFDRDHLYCYLISFLETESAKLILMRIDKNGGRHLYYAVANQFLLRMMSRLTSGLVKERFLITHAEAIMLLSMVEGTSSITLTEIRSAIHKLLS